MFRPDTGGLNFGETVSYSFRPVGWYLTKLGDSGRDGEPSQQRRTRRWSNIGQGSTYSGRTISHWTNHFLYSSTASSLFSGRRHYQQRRIQWDECSTGPYDTLCTPHSLHADGGVFVSFEKDSECQHHSSVSKLHLHFQGVRPASLVQAWDQECGTSVQYYLWSRIKDL